MERVRMAYKADTGMGVREEELDFLPVGTTDVYAVDTTNMSRELRSKIIMSELLVIPDYDYIEWLERKLDELLQAT